MLVIAALAGYLTKAGAGHRIQALYGGALRSHPSVANHAIDDAPLEVIDTAGRGFEEETPEASESKANEGEAALAAAEVERILGMVDGCLRARVHYLDITGEVTVFEGLAARDAVGRRRGFAAGSPAAAIPLPRARFSGG